ncbi:MAG: M3 family metallopeptidase [Microbacter sp.]
MPNFSQLKSELNNPFFEEYKTPYGVPPFDLIKSEDYLPAFEVGIKGQEAEIKKIATNPAPPTFENTIEAFEYSGKILERVNAVFFNMLESKHDETLEKIAETIMPKLTEHANNIYFNELLFKRIKYLRQNKALLYLNNEQKKAIEEHYKNFVRNGSELNDEDKKKLREIDQNLSMLELQFSNNVLKETNSFKLIIEDQTDLDGLPNEIVEAASEQAKLVEMPNKWVFTLHKTSLIPFLTYSKKRPLREKIYRAYIERCHNENDFDNKKIVVEIIKNRIELAQLMGYKTPAAYILHDKMAENPSNAEELLWQLWEPALKKAKEEALELQHEINTENEHFKLAPWDWWYYAEKIRRSKYDLDENALKPYFQLENVLHGAFEVAKRLFGLSFEKLQNMPVYEKGIEVYKVYGEDNKLIGIFYTDYQQRKNKTVGAWMDNFCRQYIENCKNIRPVVVNVASFAKPYKNIPSLLTMDDVSTLFHEFGHALHGLLSQVTYPSLSGTNVPRDFVEFPSQFMENYALHREVLKLYAIHYQTKEVIPDELIDKMEQATYFNQGFEMTELLAAAFLDLKWHSLTSVENIDVDLFEQNLMNEIGLIPEIFPRYRSTYFKHIFSDHYEAGYYSYPWASVIEKDAFEMIREKGIFDQQTAKTLKETILEKGNSVDLMKAYINFRGRKPKTEALLKARGMKTK